MNRLYKRKTNTKRLKTNAHLIKSNKKGSKEFLSRSKNNRKSMEYRPHMLILNIIKFCKSLDLKIHKYKIYKGKIRRSKINASISKICMRPSEATGIYTPKTSFDQNKK